MTPDIKLPERDTEHERVLGILYNISPAQSAVLSCLVRGTVATGEQLMEYSGVNPPIRVVVARARYKMRDAGFDIFSKRSIGYWMSAEDRAHVQKAVENFLAGG